MTPKRRLLAALALLVLAAPLVLALLMPQLFVWNSYRDTVAAVASGRLGRPVTIAGPISLAVWPAPELTAEQVDIGGDSAIHVAALRLRVGLWPLLAGRVEARDLVLRGLDLRLPWPLPQALLASRPPRWVGAFAARIEGGTLHLGALTLGGIDATVTQGEDGMLAAAGTAQMNAWTGRFTIGLRAPAGDGTAGLDVSLDGLDKLAGTDAGFGGTVAADGSVAGHLTVRGSDLALLIGAPSLPFRADGRLTIGDGLAAMDEAVFDLAGTPASGALALRWSPAARMDVALSATRMNLDPWLAALHPAAGGNAAWPALPIGLDLAVEAATLQGGTLQHLRGRADRDGGTVTLSDVSAILPGEAQMRLAGTLDIATSRLVGALRLDAPALRTTLRWLNDSRIAQLPLPTAAVLRTASIAATLHAEPGSLALEGLTGRVDGAAVAGSLQLNSGAHPGFAVDLATDQLALDPWLADEAVASAPANWLGHGGLAKLLGGATAHVSVRAEHAAWHGLPIDGLVLDTTAADGALSLRALEGTARGLRLSAAGTFGGDGRIADAKFSLRGPSALPLAAFVPAGFATPGFWNSPVALEITGGGPPSALALGLLLDLGDARLEAQPAIDLLAGTWRASASLRHPGATRFLGLLGLGASPDITSANTWLGEGSLSLLGQFSGGPGPDAWGKVAADNFEVTAGTLRASGSLALEGRQFHGSIAADVLPLPLPDPASQAPLPIGALHGWHGTAQVQAAQIVAAPLTLLDHAALTVTLTDDALTIDGLTGQLGDGKLSASASLNFGASPPALTAAATLHDAAIRAPADDQAVGLLSGHLDGAVDLAASGYSPAALVATLSGNLHATARDGALAGFDLFGLARAMGTADANPPAETEQDLRAALENGTTSFDRFDITGEAAHGMLHLTDATLQGPAGNAQAKGNVGLTDGTMDVQIALVPSVPGAPTVGLRLDGPLTAPARQLELAAAVRWLAERAVTR